MEEEEEEVVVVVVVVVVRKGRNFNEVSTVIQAQGALVNFQQYSNTLSNPPPVNRKKIFRKKLLLFCIDLMVRLHLGGLKCTYLHPSKYLIR